MYKGVHNNSTVCNKRGELHVTYIEIHWLILMSLLLGLEPTNGILENPIQKNHLISSLLPFFLFSFFFSWLVQASQCTFASSIGYWIMKVKHSLPSICNEIEGWNYFKDSNKFDKSFIFYFQNLLFILMVIPLYFHCFPIMLE